MNRCGHIRIPSVQKLVASQFDVRNPEAIDDIGNGVTSLPRYFGNGSGRRILIRREATQFPIQMDLNHAESCTFLPQLTAFRALQSRREPPRQRGMKSQS